MITTDKKHVDMQQHVVTVTGIPSLTISKVILFYVGISVLKKKNSSLYSNCPDIIVNAQ